MTGFLIVGGGGNVGKRIAAQLVQAGAPVWIGGRNVRGGKARVMDVAQPTTWAPALAGIGTVIVCIDLPDAGFAAAVLAQGLRYIDISASDAVLRGIEALDPIARASGGAAVLSVGLAPGLSNLMAVAAAQGLDAPRIEIGILLGLGDHHGPAAIDWTLDRTPKTPEIRKIAFAKGPPMPAMAFDFADQHVLRRRGWDATTWLAFGPPITAAWVLRLIARWASSRTMRAVLHRSPLRLGPDRVALVVTAGQRRLTFEAAGEASITALVAARVALSAHRHPAGVHHIQDVHDLADFTGDLTAAGARLTG